jgi:hypothetical protein
MSDQTPQGGYPQQQPPVQSGPPQQPYGQPIAQQGYVQPQHPEPQYPQQQYPQSGQLQPMYQQTVVYASYQPQPKGFSITALVLGLVSLFFGFTFIVPIGAIIFGSLGVKREPTAKGMSVTGIVLGGVCLLGWVVVVLIWVFAAIVFAGAVASSASYVS